MCNTLFLILDGPLQAWGGSNHWSIRDTMPEPTKSGVVGLLACALGWNEDERIQELAQMIQIGVRCDRAGTRVVDYHTVGGGYPTPQLLNAKGKLKHRKHRPYTEQTWRTYLCDAVFLVAVRAQTMDRIAMLASAVQHPHWPIYLGRRSCIPSRPVFAGTGNYESLEAALISQPLACTDRQASESARVRAIVESTDDTGLRRNDVPDLRSSRTFLPRRVQVVWLTLSVPEE